LPVHIVYSAGRMLPIRVRAFVDLCGGLHDESVIAKFRVHASAKVPDERYFVSARQARSGENNDLSTGFVFFHQAMS
jgi:hypothetical protein